MILIHEVRRPGRVPSSPLALPDPKRIERIHGREKALAEAAGAAARFLEGYPEVKGLSLTRIGAHVRLLVRAAKGMDQRIRSRGEDLLMELESLAPGFTFTLEVAEASGPSAPMRGTLLHEHPPERG